ncbi:MAG: cell wall hydrolase [Lachnospiraceae bacterium]|nr:cell wall hydrolase [Lachnospiraceae bacterium]
MYKKYILALVLFNLIIVMAIINITALKVNHILTTPAFLLNMEKTLAPPVQTSYEKLNETVSSGQRIIGYILLEQPEKITLSEEDYEVLLRIVEAEAGGEDIEGRMLVANVVLNRVADERFPDTVKEVVFQREHGVAQFSPAYSGRYDRVVVSEDTIEAVDRVLAGEDISEGALFFASRKHAGSDKMRWFDEHLTFLFSHGGHEFFH